MKLQPQWILVSARTLDQVGGKQGLLDNYPALKSLPAGNSEHIISIPGHALIGGLGLESLRLTETIQTQLIAQPLAQE